MIETTRPADGHGSVHLELCVPERANALSAGLVDALVDSLTDVLREPPPLLVLRGRGRSFCAGFDLAGLEGESDASLARRFLRIEHLLQLVNGAPCCTLALAQGPVAGAGADLFAACTRRVAAPDSSFRFPGPRFGVVLGTGRLMRLIGPHAQAALLGQQTFDAEAALRVGLADTLAPTDGWHALAASLAASAAQVPPETARRISSLRRAHDDAEMGQLAHSVLQPGLQRRMSDYWQQVRARPRPP
jgi:enoyl-CoA hydratase/carnithine racemase